MIYSIRALTFVLHLHLPGLVYTSPLGIGFV